MAARKKRRSTTDAEATQQRRRAEVGAQAQQLAENPVLREALEELEAIYFGRFKAATTPEEAWRAKQLCDAHQDFQQHLVGYILAGRDASRLLHHEEKLREDRVPAYDFGEYMNRAKAARKEWAAGSNGSTTS